MSKEKRIVFRIEEELYDKFKNICERNDKNISKVLRDYIDRVVEKGDKENRENKLNFMSKQSQDLNLGY